MADGQVVFEITADGKHAIASVRDITNAIDRETRNWDRATQQSTANIESSFMGTAKKIAAGIGAAQIGKAILNWGKAAIDAASDLAEVQNVVDVTFGDGAKQIESWSKTAGKQFGLTETQAKKFTSTLGAMMKSAGMSGDEIIGMSTDLAGLAADMASFYNLDFETAFQKIRSGISGETEPLKQLGINMSVANLEAFALEKGITKAFNSMSQQEQTMLRYQYLMQATADAQGDFARTSDGFANASRRVEAALDTISTKGGSILMTIIEPLTTGFAGLLEKMTQQPERTVLDDFADIDKQTETKLAQITETAEQARLLTEELEKIGGSKANQARSNVQQIVNGLAEINLDQGKTGIVKDFISTLANNIDVLAEVQGTDADGAKAWLDGIAESANKLDPDDAEGWASLIASIKEGLPGLENTDFGAAFFSALGDGFSDVEQKSSVLEWAVDALGNKTNRTAQEQALWLETCKRLVRTIPGLSSIINTETGEIKGGTDAVKEYIQAWEDGQKKLALLGAVEQKESALSSRFSELPGLELDMAVARRRMRKSFEQLKNLYAQYGMDLAFNEDGSVYRGGFNDVYGGLSAEEKAMLNRETDYFEQLKREEQAASDAYNKQKDALDEAKVSLEEYRETVNEMPGTIEEAAGESEKFWIDNADNIKLSVNATNEALKALEDYAKGVHDATEQAVNSVVKGFETITRPTTELEKKRDNLIQQQNELNRSTKEGEKKYQELQNQIDELNESMDQYSPKGMQDSLKSQIAFMDEYIRNLEKAREMGLSNDLLASLSDGSVASAEYLSQLVANPEQAGEVDKLFQQVQEKKKGFTDALTQQKLTVDETYNAMVAKAKDAIAEMNQGEAAAAAMGNTVSGLAEGISSHVSEVSTAVDSIIAELDRLNSFGVSIDLGSFGSINFTLPFGLDGSFATGLDYVPFNGFLAELHEGEGILTAEENRIWQRFKNGGAASQNVDYDALGATMRANVKPGGNVYLDGRVVGSVISEQQGRSYRALQRSGWQS